MQAFSCRAPSKHILHSKYPLLIRRRSPPRGVQGLGTTTLANIWSQLSSLNAVRRKTHRQTEGADLQKTFCPQLVQPARYFGHAGEVDGATWSTTVRGCCLFGGRSPTIQRRACQHDPPSTADIELPNISRTPGPPCATKHLGGPRLDQQKNARPPSTSKGG